MKLLPQALLLGLLSAASLQAQAAGREIVGIALGGGSARGIAHVGVIRWLEEHRIPIDRIAGTSMGGLVGGAYATGMSSAEIAALLGRTDWDEMFGASSYRFMNIVQKEDARAYPARLQLQMRRGVTLPVSLNDGQQIDLLLAGVAARYSGLRSFDLLPTPFRCVALDLRSGHAVTLESGSLARAMRATMSLPGVFPPVEMGGVLVDGGAVNNVPADVVKAMGATRVIAVDVGQVSDSATFGNSLFSIVRATTSALTRANTRRGMAAADILIDVRLDSVSLSSDDWRHSEAIADAGYRAAESMAARLLPLSVDQETWDRHLAERAARRRDVPTIIGVEVRPAGLVDERRIRARVQRFVGQPLDETAVSGAVVALSGLDRYETVFWDVEPSERGAVLVIHARRHHNAPPTLMTSVNIENRSNQAFSVQVAARGVAYDIPLRGAQLRVDGAVGSDPHLGAALRKNVAGPFFLAGQAGIGRNHVGLSVNDALVAEYTTTAIAASADVGVTLGLNNEFRTGVSVDRARARVAVGSARLPSVTGSKAQLTMLGIHDTQNHPAIPSRGLRIVTAGRYVFAASEPFQSIPALSSEGLTQAAIGVTGVRSWHKARERVFVVANGASSFGTSPLPTEQFSLGLPFRLQAFSPGERRGDNLVTLAGGYLHAIGRLPDVLGGPALVGAWMESGSAFDQTSDAAIFGQVHLGMIVETLIGPALVGYGVGGGGSRFYFSMGRQSRLSARRDIL
jgi:NTE family protein